MHSVNVTGLHYTNAHGLCPCIHNLLKAIMTPSSIFYHPICVLIFCHRPICPQMPSSYPLHLLEPVNAKRVGTNAKYEHGLEHDEKHCLNLNVYVPVETLNKKDVDGVELVPVMVWIHGGAFRDGSNGLPMYGMCLL